MSRPMKRKLVSSAALCCAGVVVGAAWFPVRTGAAEESSKPWASKVVSWNEAKGPTADWGEIRLHFQGETFATKDMLTGIAVVKPGQALHGAHRHAEEEYLVLIAGSGTWHLDGKDIPAKAGDVLYVEPWVYHGLTNTSNAPLKFFVVKYNGKGVTPPPRPTDSRPDEL